MSKALGLGRMRPIRATAMKVGRGIGTGGDSEACSDGTRRDQISGGYT
jgi:hypothetical protein